MRLKTWSTFVASAIVGAALVVPLNASAFMRRMYAAQCFVTGPFQAQGGGIGITPTAMAPGNQWPQVECPVPDDDSLLPQDMRFVNVHGTNNLASGGGAGATACISYWDIPGATCQYTNGTFATGRFVLTPDHSMVWSSANFNHFKYLSIGLAPGTYLTGIFFSN